MALPAVLFVPFALAQWATGGEARALMTAVASISAFAFVAAARPRTVGVAGGRIIVKGPFGTKSADVRGVRCVEFRQSVGPRGVRDRRLLFHLRDASSTLQMPFPVDARATAELSTVLRAIAAQADAVSFDHASERIRAGQLD
jgi:hypothetical protein